MSNRSALSFSRQASAAFRSVSSVSGTLTPLIGGSTTTRSTGEGRSASSSSCMRRPSSVISDSGDLVAQRRSVVDGLLLEVEWVGGVVDEVTLQRHPPRCKGLGSNRSLPELDSLLCRPLVRQVAEAGRSATHEAAALHFDRV